MSRFTSGVVTEWGGGQSQQSGHRARHVPPLCFDALVFSSGAATTTLSGRSLASLIVPRVCHRGDGSPALLRSFKVIVPLSPAFELQSSCDGAHTESGGLADETGVHAVRQRREIAGGVEQRCRLSRRALGHRDRRRADCDGNHQATQRTAPGLHGANLHSEDVSSGGAGRIRTRPATGAIVPVRVANTSGEEPLGDATDGGSERFTNSGLPCYDTRMSDTTHPILIGTSGWSYPEWEGVFYPPGMDPADYLAWYSDRFPIVEVDSTFYRVPPRRMVQGWRNHTPPGFRFALKVPQVITHKKQLKDCGADVEEFIAAIRAAGREALVRAAPDGVFQPIAVRRPGRLPAGPRPVPDVMAPRPVPLALETRNPRWVGPELAEVLRRHQTALALTLRNGCRGRRRS